MHRRDAAAVGVPLRILIVESDPAAAALLQRAQDKGAPNVELQRVANGQEALEFLRREAPYEEVKRPHIVVTSLASQDDERELVQSIKRDDTVEDIPIIVLTLRADQDGHYEPSQVRGGLIVAKPMNFHDLVALFRELESFFGDVVSLPDKPGRRW